MRLAFGKTLVELGLKSKDLYVVEVASDAGEALRLLVTGSRLIHITK